MNISRASNNNKNGGAQACAACKFQRRKCAPDCLLAPYFPHDRQIQFLNAHKLFGVRKITKIIEKLDPLEKDMAMKTIMYQSDMRAFDPVGGCYRVITELHRQMAYNEAELELVLRQLAVCRSQQAQLQMADNSNSTTTTLGCDLVNSYNQMQQNHYYDIQPGNKYVIQSNNQQLQENDDAWAMQDSVFQVMPEPQPFSSEHDDQDVEKRYERHEIGFESEEFVDRRFVPSTQLGMCNS